MEDQDKLILIMSNLRHAHALMIPAGWAAEDLKKTELREKLEKIIESIAEAHNLC